MHGYGGSGGSRVATGNPRAAEEEILFFIVAAQIGFRQSFRSSPFPVECASGSAGRAGRGRARDRAFLDSLPLAVVNVTILRGWTRMPLRGGFSHLQCRQHRARPCKERKSGAPTVVVLSARSKAWATRRLLLVRVDLVHFEFQGPS